MAVSRHKALERQISEYYLSIEEDMRKDLGVSEETIDERVQSMVEAGYIERPVILVITKDGPRWIAVDYHAYKEYMASDALTSRKYYGVQPDILDTVLTDSIRSNILEALKADSINPE